MVYIVCHFICIFWTYYCIVRPNCSISRTITQQTLKSVSILPKSLHNIVLYKRKHSVIIRDNLLILHKNICCDPSSELSRRDDSDEGSHHMVSMRNKKNYYRILPLGLNIFISENNIHDYNYYYIHKHNRIRTKANTPSYLEL